MATFINKTPDIHGRIENTRTLFVRTNIGGVTFHCNTGNKYEAISQLKNEFGIKTADVHHATYI